MKQRTKQILFVLHILAWIIFIGLCIKTGAILYSFFVSHAINEDAARNLHLGLNLSKLHDYDPGHYSVVVGLMILVSAMKALIFYFVIKIFLKINMMHPFSITIFRYISFISYLALGIGIFTIYGNNYCEWLTTKGLTFPDMDHYLGGGPEFLFFAAVIFFISQVYKRGIEIQIENELTV